MIITRQQGAYELAKDLRARRAARRMALAVWSTTFVVLLLGWYGWYHFPRATRAHHELHMLSVGNGNAVLMVTPDRQAVLFDIGTDRNLDAGEMLARAARLLNVDRLAAIVISHGNFDHCSGLASTFDKVPVQALLLSAYTACGQDKAPAVAQVLPQPGQPEWLQRVRAGDVLALAGMPVEVLWPSADLDLRNWNANDRSLVLRVHAGACCVLITGDIESRAMRELLAADASGEIRLTSDVLIAPHHGSVVPESARFFAAVNPEIVLLSTAEDRPKLAAMLSHVLGPEARCVSTARDGAVTLTIQRDGDLRLATARGRGGDDRLRR